MRRRGMLVTVRLESSGGPHISLEALDHQATQHGTGVSPGGRTVVGLGAAGERLGNYRGDGAVWRGQAPESGSASTFVPTRGQGIRGRPRCLSKAILPTDGYGAYVARKVLSYHWGGQSFEGRKHWREWAKGDSG